MNVFDQMGVYWAEIADKNPTQMQTQFIRETLKTQGLILDLACGTGRHMITLSKEGYDVVGLDISLNLLKIAKTRLSGIPVVRADMRHLPFRQQMFAAATSMDTNFGYLVAEEDDLQSLMELRKTLKLNGTLIIDVFNREQLMQKYTDKSPVNPKEREYPSFFLLQKRTVDKNGSRLRDLWIVRNKTDGKIRVFTHVVRLYSLKVLQTLLEKGDFRVEGIYGDYNRQKFSPESNRLILVTSAK